VNAASLDMKIVDRDDEPLVGTNKRFLSDIFDIESDDEPSTVSVRIPRRLRGNYDGVLIELVSDGWQVRCIEGEQQTDTGLKYLGRARKGQGVRTLWLREADLGRRLLKDFKAAQRLDRRGEVRLSGTLGKV
jgi:hypothetical protein